MYLLRNYHTVYRDLIFSPWSKYALMEHYELSPIFFSTSVTTKRWRAKKKKISLNIGKRIIFHLCKSVEEGSRLKSICINLSRAPKFKNRFESTADIMILSLTTFLSLLFAFSAFFHRYQLNIKEKKKRAPKSYFEHSHSLPP